MTEMTCFGVANITSKIFYDSDVVHGMTFICSEDYCQVSDNCTAKCVIQRHLKLAVFVLISIIRLGYQNIVSTNKIWFRNCIHNHKTV